MRIFILTARRSVAPFGGIAVALLTTWLALAAMTPGFRLWPDLVTGLSSSTVFTGTVAAGLAAFEAGRWKVANWRRSQAGIRSPAASRLIHAAGVVLPMVAGYILAILVLFIYAKVAGVYGMPSIAWLAAVGATLVLASAFGYVVGFLFGNHWFVPPVGALCFYAIYVITLSFRLPVGVQSLFPYITNTDSIFDRHIITAMLGQLALWLALAALLAAFAGGGWRPGLRRFAFGFGMLAIVIASVGAGTVLATNGQYTEGHNPGVFVCKSGDFTLCLNPGYASALPYLHATFSRLDLLVAGTHLAPRRLEQNVEGVGDDPSEGSRSVYLEQFTDASDLEFSVYRYVSKYGATPACESRGSSVSASTIEAVDVVDAWISGYSPAAEGFPNSEHLGKLRSMSSESGNRWFRTHSTQYFACSLTLADLP